MNYELAKKLKDAGLSMKLVMGAAEWDGQKVFFDGDKTKEGGKIGFLAPTLEELIDACTGIGRSFRLTYKKETIRWRASSYYDKNLMCNGKTPTIAVANLWLALQKK